MAATTAAVALAAYGAYDSAKTNKDQRKAMKTGVQSSQEQGPWGPTVDLRKLGLLGSLDLYGKGMPEMPSFGGGGGASERTKKIVDELTKRAFDNPLANKGEGFLGDVLGSQGAEGYNPWLEKLWQGGAPKNEYLSKLLDQEMGSYLEGEKAPPKRMDPMEAYRMGTSSIGEMSAEPYLRSIIEGQYLNNGNPYTEELISNISRQIRENYTEEDIPGINTAANTRGRFGSQPWVDLQAKAAGKFQQSLGDVASELGFGQYQFERGNQMSALNSLAGIDLSKLGEAGNRGGQIINADLSEFGAKMAGRSDDRSALMSLIQGLTQEKQFGSSYLGQLASQLSADKMSAASMIPEMTGIKTRDLSAAQSGSGMIDQLNAAAGNARRSAEMQRWMYNNESPYRNLETFGQNINLFGGQGGTGAATQTGGQGVPPSYLGSILGGALQGGQVGNDLGGLIQQWMQRNRGTSTIPTYIPPANIPTAPRPAPTTIPTYNPPRWR